MPDGFDDQVESVASHVEVIHSRPDDRGYEAALASSKIILGRPAPGDVARSPAVEWLQLASAGANRYVGNIPEHVILTTATGVFGIPVAEHAFAMMLAHTRSLPKSVRDQSQRRWSRDGTYRELYDNTCGLLGLGDIGMAVACRARAFGMRVLAVRRDADNRPDPVDELYSLDRMDDMLAQCDFVVNTLPATDATRKVLNATSLRAMKKGSFLCNVGRGATVDQAALVQALQDGHLAGAGLDVFDEEPLPEASPLWTMDSVIITPHVAGLSPREEERLAELFLSNLKRYVRGEALLNRLDPKVGY